MADSFVETETTGFLGNMGKSIMMVPIGILLFLASFAVFWFTEGRTDWSKVAKESVEVAAGTASGQDGKFVSVTGALTSDEKLGDSDFLAPGEWITLDRRTEMYAWVEDVETESKKKTGGKTKTTKTYNYNTEWTSSPRQSGDFKYPQGHENPPMTVPSAEFAVKTAKVGAWSFAAGDAQLPGGDSVPLADAQLVAKGKSGAKVGDYVYMSKGTPDVPQVGDVRVSWSGLAAGGTVTLFGAASGANIGPHMHNDEDRFLRAVEGNRGEAIAHLKSEYKAMGWVGRIAGFLMMWIGMTMVFAPLHGIMDILPFMGRVSRGLVGCITFPVALVLSTIAILISMLLHSIVAMIVVTLILGGLGFFAWKKKQAEAGA